MCTIQYLLKQGPTQHTHMAHPAPSAIQIVSRIGGAPSENIPNFKYDAPEEVCGDRKLLDSPLQK